jgi:hypothetical protein
MILLDGDPFTVRDLMTFLLAYGFQVYKNELAEDCSKLYSAEMYYSVRDHSNRSDHIKVTTLKFYNSSYSDLRCRAQLTKADIPDDFLQNMEISLL